MSEKKIGFFFSNFLYYIILYTRGCLQRGGGVGSHGAYIFKGRGDGGQRGLLRGEGRVTWACAGGEEQGGRRTVAARGQSVCSYMIGGQFG